MIFALIRIYEVTLAQTSDLIVHGIKHAQRMSCPVAMRIWIWSDLLTGVADEKRGIPLRNRLEPQVVIHTAVAQDYLLGVRHLVKICARAC